MVVLATLVTALALVAAACQGPDPSSVPSASTSRPTGVTPSPGPVSPGASFVASFGASPGATAAGRLGRIAITLEPFAQVPGGPLAVAAPDDGTGRLFVAAQDGKVWLVGRDGAVAPTPMVDLGPRLRSGGEQGLLGIATHPAFPTDPRVFVNYTDEAGDTVVASLTLDPSNPDRLAARSHAQLLFVDQPFPNHNGGGVLFGPDGYLYLSLGDGGGGGDPHGNGQSLQSMLGKVLRIDVDATAAETPYVVPSDNPFAGGGGLPEIWHWGLRNPWRLSFDRATNDLWIGDVGQAAWEEIDVARAGVGGLNFGWNEMEGAHCYGSGACSTDGLTLPVSEYARDLGCTVIGGYVYRGAQFPFLVGTYLSADYCSGRIFAIGAASDGLVAPVTVGNGGGRIAAFGEDAEGELYVLALEGDVSRVVATER